MIGRLITRYVLPNALLPQITFLAPQIGLMFNGSLITEIILRRIAGTADTTNWIHILAKLTTSASHRSRL